MTIEEMAERRVYLEARLTAHQMMNMSGKTLDELTRNEVDRIKTQKELNRILVGIKSFERGEWK